MIFIHHVYPQSHLCIERLDDFSFLGCRFGLGGLFLWWYLLKLNKHQWVVPPLVVLCLLCPEIRFVKAGHEHVFRSQQLPGGLRFIGTPLVFRGTWAATGFHCRLRGKYVEEYDNKRVFPKIEAPPVIIQSSSIYRWNFPNHPYHPFWGTPMTMEIPKSPFPMAPPPRLAHRAVGFYCCASPAKNTFGCEGDAQSLAPWRRKWSSDLRWGLCFFSVSQMENPLENIHRYIFVFC